MAATMICSVLSAAASASRASESTVVLVSMSPPRLMATGKAASVSSVKVGSERT